ncbi:MAG TPA: hypothetical protein VFC53_01590 [Dehalococcoidia bacterium]|nr:hypothetical protein [Dehalococcoidia bacterium]
MASKWHTVQILRTQREQLEEYREHPRETMADLMERVLRLASEARERAKDKRPMRRAS